MTILFTKEQMTQEVEEICAKLENDGYDFATNPSTVIKANIRNEFFKNHAQNEISRPMLINAINAITEKYINKAKGVVKDEENSCSEDEKICGSCERKTSTIILSKEQIAQEVKEICAKLENDGYDFANISRNVVRAHIRNEFLKNHKIEEVSRSILTDTINNIADKYINKAKGVVKDEKIPDDVMTNELKQICEQVAHENNFENYDDKFIRLLSSVRSKYLKLHEFKTIDITSFYEISEKIAKEFITKQNEQQQIDEEVNELLVNVPEEPKSEQHEEQKSEPTNEDIIKRDLHDICRKLRSGGFNFNASTANAHIVKLFFVNRDPSRFSIARVCYFTDLLVSDFSKMSKVNTDTEPKSERHDESKSETKSEELVKPKSEQSVEPKTEEPKTEKPSKPEQHEESINSSDSLEFIKSILCLQYSPDEYMKTLNEMKDLDAKENHNLSRARFKDNVLITDENISKLSENIAKIIKLNKYVSLTIDSSVTPYEYLASKFLCCLNLKCNTNYISFDIKSPLVILNEYVVSVILKYIIAKTENELKQYTIPERVKLYYLSFMAACENKYMVDKVDVCKECIIKLLSNKYFDDFGELNNEFTRSINEISNIADEILFSFMSHLIGTTQESVMNTNQLLKLMHYVDMNKLFNESWFIQFINENKESIRKIVENVDTIELIAIVKQIAHIYTDDISNKLNFIKTYFHC